MSSTDAGRRLDQFLVQQLPEISRARVQELIEAGSVTLDGKAAKASVRLHGGETVILSGATARPPIKAEPESIDVRIVYDDPDFAVVDKPAGMSVHAGAGDLSRSRGTLVNAMLHRFQALSQGGDELRPGIVHRLDRDTSGLVIIAKSDFAHQRLAEQFAQRTVKKTYIALVLGTLKEEQGTITYPIERDPVHRKRMRALRSGHGGRSASTHFRVLERVHGAYGGFTLLEVKIETGRTHQIRVHLAALRHAVVGDKLYGGGGPIAPEKGRGESVVLGRNFLHATDLEFEHPRTRERIRLHSDLPAELTLFLARIRADPV